MEFDGKVAVITGAASGIGLLCAQMLASQGACVAVTDVHLDQAEAAAQGIRQAGGKAMALCVDVRSYAQITDAIQAVLAAHGRIDILINSAGGAAGRVFGSTGGFHNMPLEVLDWGLDVNFKGPVYFAHAVIGHMMAQEGGVIINIGSICGETGSQAVEYSAAKSGIMYGLTKSLAQYGAPHGVRACCVTPGPVLTRPAMANMKTALGRAAQPQEVVDLIVYLCSDKAAFITGTNYLIDGGRNIMPR